LDIIHKYKFLLNSKWKKLYLIFFSSILLIFFLTRPFNSPWHKFIAGDGFGYYSYLPATFIYNDFNYEFKWFNKVHNDNYVYCTFPEPDQNLLVDYNGRRINKYYPGLSYLWAPFFLLAHFFTPFTHWKPDGFSLPYQLAIGFASVFYLLLGLYYLRKLLVLIFRNEFVGFVVPIIMFYGSNLFYYGLYLNSLSHVYSFTFITLFYYYAYVFINNCNNKSRNFLVAVLCLVLVICIRPFNGLIVLTLPALFFEKFKINDFKKLSFGYIESFFLMLIIIIFSLQMILLYTQTGSFMPYTYTNERFYFNKPKLVDVLISYHSGILIYMPILTFAFIGSFFFKKLIQKMLFPVFLILVFYLYSCWWYWPILSRSIIDFYVIFSLLIAALINHFYTRKIILFLIISFNFLCAAYYQLKNYQLHNGILVENNTYSKLFWDNFFVLDKMNQYLINPNHIVFQKTYLQNYEGVNSLVARTNKEKHKGEYSVVLNNANSFSQLFRFEMPDVFKTSSLIRKIRLSFWNKATNEVMSLHIYLKIYDKQNNLLKETAFFVNKDDIGYDNWRYNEYGYQIIDSDFKNINLVDRIEYFIWNNENKNEIYIDDIKTEFIVANESTDIIL